MFVLGWGRVYVDFWWELGRVGKTRPYRIIRMFDCFGKILGEGRSNVCPWVEAGLFILSTMIAIIRLSPETPFLPTSPKVLAASIEAYLQ